MRSFFTLVLSLFGAFASAQTPIAKWPLGDPVEYVTFLDNGSYQKDSMFNFNYRHSNCAAFAGDSSHIFFQCNGYRVANEQLQILDNGEFLADNLFSQGRYDWGISETQGVIVVPKKNNTYWIFYLSISDSIWGQSNTSPDRLYYAIVDMNANGGAGKVVQKKVPLYKGMMGDCRITACKHGNGRDYWLVNHQWNNNCYNKWLVTPDTVIGPFVQCIGDIHQEPDLFGMAKFNEDGTLYAMGSSNGLLDVMDFNRCTGIFSNVRAITVYSEPPYTITPAVSFITGLAFSPSSRFLYVTAFDYLLQYDLQANPIDSSRILLAKTDSTFTNADPFFLIYLMPNNKILIGNFQGIPASCYHIINYPDSLGSSCNFQKESLCMPNNWAADICIPNVFNLNLGQILGCDTFYNAIASNASKRPVIRSFPNPAYDYFYIELPDENEWLELNITSISGQLILTKYFETNTMIDIRGFESGLYFYTVKSQTNEYNGKFIVHE